jgi:hypothetical protein
MREQILEEIKRLANKNGGKSPGTRAFERQTLVKREEGLRHREAGGLMCASRTRAWGNARRTLVDRCRMCCQ